MDKLQRRRDEYVIALRRSDWMSARNALRALLDECRDSCIDAEAARKFLLNECTIHYADLIAFEAAGGLDLNSSEILTLPK